MATHFSILAWEIPWREKRGGLHGVAKNWTRLSMHTHTHTHRDTHTHTGQKKEGFPVEELSRLGAKGCKVLPSVWLLEPHRHPGREGSWWEAQCQPHFFSFIFISWRLITLQYCSGFCHTLTWISHGFTCIPHPDLPSHLPLYPIPLGLPSAPGPSTGLMHPTWAGDLFHPW